MYPLHKTQIPLHDLNEEISIANLPIQGTLPFWLEGTLIRNGPAKFHFGNQEIAHWFDGLAMLHAFTFGGGKVSYRNKFLRSKAYQQCMEHQNVHFMGFSEDPCKSVFKRFFAYFFPSLTPSIVQNANVNIMKIAENYVALTETPLPVCFDPYNLETLGSLNFQDSLSKANCFESAHPHHDSQKKEIINFQISFGRKAHYTIYTVSDKGEATRKPFFTLQTDMASYMHTFALTEHYVVLVEFPLLLKPIALLVKSGGYITNFKWIKSRGTRFNVIDRRNGKRMKTFESEAFFCFHHVNAFEEKDTIVIDLVMYPDAQIVFQEPPPKQKRKLERFRLHLGNGLLSQHTIAETLLELPRISYQEYNTKPYHYVYGVGFKYPETGRDAINLIKANVQTGAIEEWTEPGALAGEPVFVPYPNGKDEDEGLLLSVVSNQIRNNSYLLVLNAKDFREIARAEVSHFIPYGLHGMFFHI